MKITFRSRLGATVLTGAAAIAFACGGASAAHAGGAPTASSTPDVSFVVPYTHDPASTGIEVDGEVSDIFLTDNLKDFTVSISCADGMPVTPVNFTATTLGYSRWGESFSTRISLSEQGKVCTIHSTSPSQFRQLNIVTPFDKPDDHNGDRLYFVGSVIQRVTTRGGQY